MNRFYSSLYSAIYPRLPIFAQNAACTTGGWMRFRERFNEHFGKLYFNTAGREIGIGTLKCALTNINPRRLLFGTDYPPNFVDDPMGMRTYIQEIRQLDLDREWIEAILSTNGIELLGL